jgi:hypothetical protein
VGFYDVSADVIIFAVVGVLALIMRWVFRPSRPPTGRPVDASEARELGLLTVIRIAVPREQARAELASLQTAGIRTSLSRRHDGLLDVLVFDRDVLRAQTVLGR